MPLQHVVGDAVRAAIVEDRSFGELLPQLMEAPPNLGGWLAVVSG